MIHVIELPRTDQIFTHMGGDRLAPTVFAVSRIRAACDRHIAPVWMTPIELHNVEMIYTSRGIEQPRLARAYATRVYAPLLFLTMPDDTQLLADGSHTYVARFLRGHRWALAYIVPQAIWRDYTVDGVPTIDLTPAELLASYSGISTNEGSRS